MATLYLLSQSKLFVALDAAQFATDKITRFQHKQRNDGDLQVLSRRKM